MYHELTVYGFTMDSIANMPVVILKDAEEKKTLPVWISAKEAVAMATELIGSNVAGESSENDLFGNLLARIGVQLEKILIDDVRDGLLVASAVFSIGSEEICIPAKTVEALSLSLKHQKPILISEELLEKAVVLDAGVSTQNDENNARRFVDFLENLKPEEMGKYPM